MKRNAVEVDAQNYQKNVRLLPDQNIEKLLLITILLPAIALPILLFTIEPSTNQVFTTLIIYLILTLLPLSIAEKKERQRLLDMASVGYNLQMRPQRAKLIGRHTYTVIKADTNDNITNHSKFHKLTQKQRK